MGRKKLQKLRKKIAFLGLIPDSIYFNLDPDEFYIPDERTANIRDELEQKIGHYVMTYKHNVFKKNIPPNKHLCVHLRGAELNEEKRFLLEEYEQKVKKYNISFVVYQKPLMFTKPEKSALSNMLGKLFL